MKNEDAQSRSARSLRLTTLAGVAFAVLGATSLAILAYLRYVYRGLFQVLHAGDASPQLAMKMTAVLEALWYYVCPALSFLLIVAGCTLMTRSSSQREAREL